MLKVYNSLKASDLESKQNTNLLYVQSTSHFTKKCHGVLSDPQVGKGFKFSFLFTHTLQMKKLALNTMIYQRVH